MDIKILSEHIQQRFGSKILALTTDYDELTIEVLPSELLYVCQALRDEPLFCFEELIDLAGVDYSEYGVAEWTTNTATSSGFSRGVEKKSALNKWEKPRFAVVYHLLSLTLNRRLRLKTFVSEAQPIVPSVIDIWNSANWYEREAFDLFGILFEGHPDLRRLLTDYGFIGHPFRKDFPLIGNVEMRYSAKEQRVIYEPVSIKPRTLVPKTIRSDHRYLDGKEEVHG